MKIRQTLAASALILASLGVSAANATTYLWSFTDATAGGIIASGHIVVTGGNAVSGSGTLLDPNQGITTAESLTLYPGSGSLGHFASGGDQIFDNAFNESDLTNPLTGDGLEFVAQPFDATNYHLDTGLNIWGNGGGSFTGYVETPDNLIYQVDNGAFSVTAVPEPATWAMLILGFFGVGYMVRGAQRKQAAAVA